jgi:hypothetical protein
MPSEVSKDSGDHRNININREKEDSVRGLDDEEGESERTGQVWGSSWLLNPLEVEWLSTVAQLRRSELPGSAAGLLDCEPHFHRTLEGQACPAGSLG